MSTIQQSLIRSPICFIIIVKHFIYGRALLPSFLKAAFISTYFIVIIDFKIMVCTRMYQLSRSIRGRRLTKGLRTLLSPPRTSCNSLRPFIPEGWTELGQRKGTAFHSPFLAKDVPLSLTMTLY